LGRDGNRQHAANIEAETSPVTVKDILRKQDDKAVLQMERLILVQEIGAEATS
jgi:hypothetical protein